MDDPQHLSAPTTPADSSPTTTVMRAIVQDAYGDADALQLVHIPAPEAGADHVLIRVRAASAHIGDWHVMTGQPYLMRVMGFGFRSPKARVRGMDAAGTVAAVGANVTAFRVGDEVYGSCDGAFAEYATARVETLARKPAILTFEQTAAVPTSACTALQALRIGEISAGQRVLIIGASGGVGLFAVQIAQAFGAEVTGVCSRSKIELVRSVGADHVIDYAETDISAIEQRFDLVLDMGGNRTLSQLRRCLTPRGTLVLVGGEGGGRLVGGALLRSLRAVALSPFVRQRLRMVVSATKAEDLQTLNDLIEDGKITPVVDRTYPLSEAADAIRRLHSGEARGKIVITV
ncbi:NAD(P)-dependent alcohol dehydrogenase [Microlunatus panaciterrae]|uniref:NADPH:quinone reductase-like Zn-dependent oxidoreductase n=1 Tax=Microlunatus panaciterrae TaxID=400768 RepID=A0ABS2RHZ1_9ACTN|nr:NAD(P)-dependent alcohol dehydrogenase [Microlunatus panaciterrae]MBM7798157.1 NADPH:quinone reductase-like Zn-dependent oxidoreductase [Microlunatus panaciterrae]